MRPRYSRRVPPRFHALRERCWRAPRHECPIPTYKPNSAAARHTRAGIVEAAVDRDAAPRAARLLSAPDHAGHVLGVERVDLDVAAKIRELIAGATEQHELGV